MEFRKTELWDIDAILAIIEDAKAYLKNKGIDQWQNGYPNKEVIIEDISKGHSYVMLQNNRIIATAAISFDGEVTYNKIYEGNWICDNPYAVIHRIAVANDLRGQGISSTLIQYIESLCKEEGIRSIRVDTHSMNMSMQNLLKRHEFIYCGIIYLLDGNMRFAYEKQL